MALVNCGFCKGSGKSDCISCSGKGYDRNGDECTSCGGSGEVNCDNCGGSGQVEEDEPEDDPEG